MTDRLANQESAGSVGRRRRSRLLAALGSLAILGLSGSQDETTLREANRYANRGVAMLEQVSIR